MGSKTTEKKTNGWSPWGARKLDSGSLLTRDRIAGRFPGVGARLPLPKLESLIGTSSLGLCPAAIESLGAEACPDGAGLQWLIGPGRPAVLVALAGGAGAVSPRAVVVLGLGQAREIVDRALGRPALGLTGGLSSGEQGALLYALDRIGGDWMAQGGASFEVRGLLSDQSQLIDYLGAPPAWRVGFNIVGEGFASRAWLYFVGPVMENPFSKPRPRIVDVAGGWPVRLRVDLGCARISLADLEDLEVKDTIVLDEGSGSGFVGGDPHAVVSSGGWRRTGRWLDPRRIALISQAEREVAVNEKVRRETEVTAVLEPPGCGDVGSMEVSVQVEVGSIKTTVENAARLVPGRILRLDRDVGPAVALRVGDKLIGRGEIVEVDGAMAVEVTEVL